MDSILLIDDDVQLCGLLTKFFYIKSASPVVLTIGDEAAAK